MIVTVAGAQELTGEPLPGAAVSVMVRAVVGDVPLMESAAQVFVPFRLAELVPEATPGQRLDGPNDAVTPESELLDTVEVRYEVWPQTVPKFCVAEKVEEPAGAATTQVEGSIEQLGALMPT